MAFNPPGFLEDRELLRPSWPRRRPMAGPRADGGICDILGLGRVWRVADALGPDSMSGRHEYDLYSDVLSSGQAAYGPAHRSLEGTTAWAACSAPPSQGVFTACPPE